MHAFVIYNLYLYNDVNFQSHIIARKDMSKMFAHMCLLTYSYTTLYTYFKWLCRMKLHIEVDNLKAKNWVASIYLLKHIGRRCHGLTTGKTGKLKRPSDEIIWAAVFFRQCFQDSPHLESLVPSYIQQNENS